MTFQIGEVYRAKSGELLEVMEFSDDSCKFRMRNPLTTEPTDYYLEGPLESLNEFSTGLALEKIDLSSYEPTGLTPKGGNTVRAEKFCEKHPKEKMVVGECPRCGGDGYTQWDGNCHLCRGTGRGFLECEICEEDARMEMEEL